MAIGYAIQEDDRQRRRERMKALNADPEFKARTAARMKALHADPEFNPLAGLSWKQKKLYYKLQRNGVSRDESLAEARRATFKNT